ncbi:Wzz/FepE/Etk N-terminal domain-containing protein [Planctobacterium marinum]|uniref:Polysaccharide chain length determinant N-terminal domain-containing protein n=1 Tax=Planctobacterium marinum TaxID=1631968 RepID=A0AA48HTG9_9ALTE|nr:hypothetical protein MACH26_32000 [Planctobacterium marinum]
MAQEPSSKYKSKNNLIQDDELDVLQLLLDLKERWKTVLGVTLLGTLLAVVIAVTIPKEYQAKVQVALPSDANVLAFNDNSLISLTKQQLFERYYQSLGATINFVEFLTKDTTAKELFPDSDLPEETLAARFAEDVSVEILEPVVVKGEAAQNPTKVEIRVSHTNESLLVETVNEYIQYTAKQLLSDLESQSKSIKSIKIFRLERQLGLLRERARQERLRQVALIEEGNEEELSKLEQQMQLIIAKAKNDRMVEIAQLEEENALELQNLKQQYQLVLERSKKDRETQIAEAREALKIAKELDITLPTPVSDFRVKRGDVAATNINLTDNPSLPLYLMGTRYLDSLIESLKGRESDELYLRELNRIAVEIERIKNDKRLEQLKNKEDDKSTIASLNELTKKIAAIKDDIALQALKNRQSDDNYIEELPDIFSEIRDLNSKSLTLEGVEPMSVTRAAVATGEAVKPDVLLIIVLGLVLSGLLALIIVLVCASMARRNK